MISASDFFLIFFFDFAKNRSSWWYEIGVSSSGGWSWLPRHLALTTNTFFLLFLNVTQIIPKSNYIELNVEDESTLGVCRSTSCLWFSPTFFSFFLLNFKPKLWFLLTEAGQRGNQWELPGLMMVLVSMIWALPTYRKAHAHLPGS